MQRCYGMILCEYCSRYWQDWWEVGVPHDHQSSPRCVSCQMTRWYQVVLHLEESVPNNGRFGMRCISNGQIPVSLLPAFPKPCFHSFILHTHEPPFQQFWKLQRDCIAYGLQTVDSWRLHANTPLHLDNRELQASLLCILAWAMVWTSIADQLGGSQHECIGPLQSKTKVWEFESRAIDISGE